MSKTVLDCCCSMTNFQVSKHKKSKQKPAENTADSSMNHPLMNYRFVNYVILHRNIANCRLVWDSLLPGKVLLASRSCITKENVEMISVESIFEREKWFTPCAFFLLYPCSRISFIREKCFNLKLPRSCLKPALRSASSFPSVDEACQALDSPGINHNSLAALHNGSFIPHSD